jgi:hypothetical protein
MPITVNLSSAIGGNPEEISLEPGAERFLTTPSRLIVWAVQFPGSDFVPGGLALMQTGQLKTLKIYKQPGGDCYQPECYEYIPPNS